MLRYIKWGAFLSCFWVLTACTQNGYYPFLYKPDVQQGNVYDQRMVDQLKIGMKADQVRYIMGEPMLINSVDTQRWQYVYYFKPDKGQVSEKHITLDFSNGVLRHIGD